VFFIFIFWKLDSVGFWDDIPRNSLIVQ